MNFPLTTYILLLICGYILGSIPFGYLVGKAKGVDILKSGSGNIGATNVNRLIGKKLGFLVLVLDALKAAVPVLLARNLLPGQQFLPALCGITAVLGHCYSPFLRFKGGKGVATIAGTFLAASPLVAISGIVVGVIVMAITRYVSLGGLLGVLSAVAFGFIFHDENAMLTLYIAAFLLTLYRHRGNVKRLLNGTESKLTFSKQGASDSKEAANASKPS